MSGYAETPGSNTLRFAELTKTFNDQLATIREAGIKPDAEIARYLGLDKAEVSRLKNGRMGQINFDRAEEAVQRASKLIQKLPANAGGPLKVTKRFSDGVDLEDYAILGRRNFEHAKQFHENAYFSTLAVAPDIQERVIDLLLGEAMRSAIDTERNPYGPFCFKWVLGACVASSDISLELLRDAVPLIALGRRACEADAFHSEFGEDVRLRTLAAILNNGGLIHLRLSKDDGSECNGRPKVDHLQNSREMFESSLDAHYFRATIRGALTCANDLGDVDWSKELLELAVVHEGADTLCWSGGMRRDLADVEEWGFLKSNRFWGIIDWRSSDAREE
jgi:hypothetical protein